ncbi:MAG: hypothetical protein IKO47_09465 [Ruminococcus sp.]|nr:hypothetical protein [Ruminococcus sp.]
MELKKKKFRIDLCGQEICYDNVKSSYKEGAEVEIYYRMIATDTDYSFYLDGKGLSYGYHPKKGYVLRFTMPNHDVTLCCYSINTSAIKPTVPTE